MGFFDSLTAPFTTDAQDKAAADQKAGLTAGYGQLTDLFGQGRNALNSSYTAGLAPFLQNYQTAQGGQNAYADATGANGTAGNARAVNNFQAGPGYQFNMDQMLQNLLRAKEATGQANSGSTDVDTLKQAGGLANQGWQSYISNLAPFLNSANAAAGGIGSLNSQLGNQQNQSFTTQGNAAYGTQTGIGNANANADLAPLSAGKNIWGLGLNAAQMAMGMPPTGGFMGGNGGGGNSNSGGSSLFSNLAGFFGGQNPGAQASSYSPGNAFSNTAPGAYAGAQPSFQNGQWNPMY